jgi:hypothetical protein
MRARNCAGKHASPVLAVSSAFGDILPKLIHMARGQAAESYPISVTRGINKKNQVIKFEPTLAATVFLVWQPIRVRDILF